GLVVSLDERKASAGQKDCVATGSIASQGKRKGSPCQQEDSSQSGEEKGYPGPELPEAYIINFCLSHILIIGTCDCDSLKQSERHIHVGFHHLSLLPQLQPNAPSISPLQWDIWIQIHSLMPMRDAARATCVSRASLCSWRSHPNLTFSMKTLGLKGRVSENVEIAKDYATKLDHILKKHSGVGVKTFQLLDAPSCSVKDHYYLDSWLQMAVKPGIEELAISPSDGNGNSIRSLYLDCCAFQPTVGFGCLRSLTSLYLGMVRITGKGLGWLLSNSFALERFTLRCCSEIYRLKIPCHLRRLSYLEVLYCRELKVIESEAPNLSNMRVAAGFQLQLLLGGAESQLGSSMPNLETLSIESTKETVNRPTVSGRFLHLKYLMIYVTVDNSPRYDYVLLASLIDASPSLATLVLDVSQRRMEHVSIFEDPSGLRQLPEQTHAKLQNVQFSGFSSAKMIELTRHILAVSTSLKKLDHIVEALRAVLAIDMYIRPKVPSTVKLCVRAMPCC
ncbi:hypothetical protein BRADI_4g03905v3, partial [Brachypodium distachyon]